MRFQDRVTVDGCQCVDMKPYPTLRMYGGQGVMPSALVSLAWVWLGCCVHCD
jgi:hypothetical protein